MRVLRFVFSILAAVCLFALHAETAGKLAPISQKNALDLLPAELRSAEFRVLDTVVAGEDVYFLVGPTYTRRDRASVILKLAGDGSHAAKLLPPGEVRSLSVDPESKVHALMSPERRGEDPRMVTCHSSLASCSTAAFADGGRHIWARQPRAGHIVELSFEGALFVDGEKLVTAPQALPAMIEPTRLLSTPNNARTVYLNQASGALYVIDPAAPSALQSAKIRGAEFEAVKKQDSDMRAWMPAEGRSGGLTIYAAALGADGSLFAALSPYNRFDGALVIRTSLDGTTQRAFRCELPQDAADGRAIHPVHLGVRGNNLILVSDLGDVLTYQL